MHQRFESVTKAHEQTSDWLFDDHDVQFVSWLQDIETSVFWISGKPGSGKSTLMRYTLRSSKLVHTIQQAVETQPYVLGNSFFHDRGTEMQKNIKRTLAIDNMPDPAQIPPSRVRHYPDTYYATQKAPEWCHKIFPMELERK